MQELTRKSTTELIGVLQAISVVASNLATRLMRLESEVKRREENSVCHVASKVRGDVESNLKDAKQYCRYAILQGVTPIIPHLMYAVDGVLNESVKSERKLGISLGLELLQQCNVDELWAFIDEDGPSTGMKQEIELAEALDIPVRFIRKEFICTETTV